MHDGQVSIFDRKPLLRYSVPAGAGLLILGVVVVGSGQVAADSGLPSKTAQELLVALQAPTAQAVSGTVSVTTDLGLPDMSALGAPKASGPMDLASGTHTLRVWADGAGGSRVDLLSRSGEYDVVRSGNDVWTWDSIDATADHYVMPDHQKDATPPAGASVPSTPQEAADLFLANVGPTTDVSTSGAGSVAGRPVYDLVLTPKQDGTKVKRVVISIDAETSVPLRVQAVSTQTGAPAIDVGFTSVDFAKPDASIFAFTPPANATVTEHPAGSKPADAYTGSSSDKKPVMVGEGWTRIAIATVPPMPDSAGSEGNADSAAAAIAALPSTSGAWGSGKVLDGTLFSVIVTDDGRMAIGAVSPEALGAALAAG